MSDEEFDLASLEEQKDDLAVRPPILWDVVFFNDDYTPMDFVVNVLMEIFGHDQETAMDIMLDIHNSDKGIAGTYVKEVAETKGTMAAEQATAEGHPLIVAVFPHEGDEE